MLLKESGDSRRAALMSKLVENFDSADADGDGRITHEEARGFDEHGSEGRNVRTAGAGDEASAMMKMVELLRAYRANEETSLLAAGSTLSLTA